MKRLILLFLVLLMAVPTFAKKRVYGPSDFMSIMKGIVPGHRIIYKFAENDSVGTAVMDVWDAPLAFLPYLASAEIIGAVSSSDEDSIGNDGARSVVILGLDSNYIEQVDTLILEGTDTVVTTNTYIRIYRAYTLTTGVDSAATGVISITAADSETLQAQIEPEHNQTVMSHYTIPANHFGILVSFTTSVAEGKESHTHISRRNFGLPVFRTVSFVDLVDNTFITQTPVYFPEKTDIKMTSLIISGPVSTMTASYILILIHNDYLGLTR